METIEKTTAVMSKQGKERLKEEDRIRSSRVVDNELYRLSNQLCNALDREAIRLHKAINPCFHNLVVESAKVSAAFQLVCKARSLLDEAHRNGVKLES